MRHSISLTMRQNDTILTIIKSDDGSNDDLLLSRIQKDAGISKDWAQAYLNSWRYSEQPTGALGAIVAAVDANRFVIEPPKRRAPIVADADLPMLPDEGKVQAILRLHDSGKSNDEIIALGFNKSTVYRQVSEHRKRKRAAAAKK